MSSSQRCKMVMGRFTNFLASLHFSGVYQKKLGGGLTLSNSAHSFGAGCQSGMPPDTGFFLTTLEPWGGRGRLALPFCACPYRHIPQGPGKNLRSPVAVDVLIGAFFASWFSLTIFGCFWPLSTTFGHLWPLVALLCCFWPLLAGAGRFSGPE